MVAPFPNVDTEPIHNTFCEGDIKTPNLIFLHLGAKIERYEKLAMQSVKTSLWAKTTGICQKISKRKIRETLYSPFKMTEFFESSFQKRIIKKNLRMGPLMFF